jgi:hypothetical protein
VTAGFTGIHLATALKPRGIHGAFTFRARQGSAAIRAGAIISSLRPPARPGLSLREKYAAAQADLAKWSMLAAAPLRGETSARGLSPEASLFAKKVARGYAAEVDLYEKALMKQNGNGLPKELEAKLAQIVKMAAGRRDMQPLGLEHPEQSTSATVEGERFPTFAAMLAARGARGGRAGAGWSSRRGVVEPTK